MQHTLQLETIRAVVSQTIAKHTSTEVDFFETVLIRDGFYCGRCFTCDAVRAVWFAEENIVKFYGADGQFLESRAVNEDVNEGWRQQAA